MIHRLHREVELTAAAAERKLDVYWLDNRHTVTEAVICLGDGSATLEDNVFSCLMFVHNLREVNTQRMRL